MSTLFDQYTGSNLGLPLVEWFPIYFESKGWTFVRVSSSIWYLATDYCLETFERHNWESYYASFAFLNKEDAIIFKLVWAGKK